MRQTNVRLVHIRASLQSGQGARRLISCDMMRCVAFSMDILMACMHIETLPCAMLCSGGKVASHKQRFGLPLAETLL